MKKGRYGWFLAGLIAILTMLCISACNNVDSLMDSSIDTSSHIHTFIESVTAPTCEEEGYTTHTCNCGESYVDSYVNASEHKFVNYLSDLKKKKRRMSKRSKEI